MTCPSCGLISPPGTEKCDCGHGLVTIPGSDLPTILKYSPRPRLLRISTISAVVGILIEAAEKIAEMQESVEASRFHDSSLVVVGVFFTFLFLYATDRSKEAVRERDEKRDETFRDAMGAKRELSRTIPGVPPTKEKFSLWAAMRSLLTARFPAAAGFAAKDGYDAMFEVPNGRWCGCKIDVTFETGRTRMGVTPISENESTVSARVSACVTPPLPHV